MREIPALSVDADPGRNQDKVEELSKKHFREVVSVLDKLYRDGQFELLIVGGHRPQVPRFVEYLTHELRPLVAGTFSVDDDTRTAFGEVKRQASAIVDRYERAEEERLGGRGGGRSGWWPKPSRSRLPAVWPCSTFRHACGRAALPP